MKIAIDKYRSSLINHAFLTRSITSAVILGISDLSAQMIQQRNEIKIKSNSNKINMSSLNFSFQIIFNFNSNPKIGGDKVLRNL